MTKINAQFSNERDDVKVVELATYRDWKQRAFSEASNNRSWTQASKARYGLTSYITSYILHHSDLRQMLNWFCCCALSVKHPKVVYDDFRTEKSPYVTGNPQTKGRRRYSIPVSGILWRFATSFLRYPKRSLYFQTASKARWKGRQCFIL